MNNEYWIEHLQQWQKFLTERSLQVDDVGEKIKIDRQRRILEEVRYAAVLNPRLFLEFINPTAMPLFSSNAMKYNLELNDSQKRAVSLAMSDSILSLIQGPPGTGKTQVIAEICLQLHQANPNVRILICSETHIAVNNLISRLAEHSDTIRIVRIRDKEQDGSSDDYSPEAIIKGYVSWLRENLENKELAELISETVSKYEDPSLEKALALSSNIVGMTCNRVGAYTYGTSREVFDVVIIDEVCKATLPEILMPLAVSKKAVLVGDPKQLPPVFCSEELDIIRSIENCHLQKYMYIDRLFSLSKCVTLLDTQYRMAKSIGSLVGELFYSGKLINGRTSENSGKVMWLNYNPSQCWPVLADDDQQQIYNLDECTIVSSLICQLDTESNKEQSIAVIAPYRSQVNRLRKIIRTLNSRHVSIRVDTVDGFQGKESDIVIFSLTRTHGSYRFLADVRRLNVALSRAKDYIYMIGYLEYAKGNKLLNSISEYCDIEFICDANLQLKSIQNRSEGEVIHT